MVTSPSFNFRTDLHFGVHMPAKNASGRVSFKANQIGGRVPSGSASFSEKLVNGTTQRFSTPSQRRQCEELTLRMFVTPGSVFLPIRYLGGVGIPHRTSANSRPCGWFRTIGAAKSGNIAGMGGMLPVL